MRRSRGIYCAAPAFSAALCVPLLMTVSAGAQSGVVENLILNGPSGAAQRLAVRFTDPKSGRQLEVRTNEPAVQLYSANGAGATDSGDGLTLRHSDAIAIETEHFPDSLNKPHVHSTVLRPGATCRLMTAFAFSTDKEPFPR